MPATSYSLMNMRNLSRIAASPQPEVIYPPIRLMSVSRSEHWNEPCRKPGFNKCWIDDRCKKGRMQNRQYPAFWKAAHRPFLFGPQRQLCRQRLENTRSAIAAGHVPALPEVGNSFFRVDPIFVARPVSQSGGLRHGGQQSRMQADQDPGRLEPYVSTGRQPMKLRF